MPDKREVGPVPDMYQGRGLTEVAQEFRGALSAWMRSVVEAMDEAAGERGDGMFGRKGTEAEFLGAYERALAISGLSVSPMTLRCVDLSIAGSEGVFGKKPGGVVKASRESSEEEEFPMLNPELGFSDRRKRAAVLFREALALQVQELQEMQMAQRVAAILAQNSGM